MIIVLGSVSIAAAKLEEALQCSREHVARSRAAPGCIEHGVYQDPVQAGRLVFVEKWADEAALKRHFSVPESIAFAEALGKMAREAPSLSIYRSEELVL